MVGWDLQDFFAGNLIREMSHTSAFSSVQNALPDTPSPLSCSTDPQTGKHLRSPIIIPNWSLRQAIERWVNSQQAKSRCVGKAASGPVNQQDGGDVDYQYVDSDMFDLLERSLSRAALSITAATQRRRSKYATRTSTCPDPLGTPSSSVAAEERQPSDSWGSASPGSDRRADVAVQGYE